MTDRSQRRRLQTAMVLLAMMLSLVMAGQAQETQAQQIECPALAQEAMQALAENCSGIGRNSACYGYNLVQASFWEEVPEDFFTLPADVSALTAMESIRATALDLESGRWGVALMNAQANVPNSIPGQAVTFLLMGDTEVQNRVDPETALEPVEPVSATVSASAGVNIRSGPGTNNNVIGLVQARAELQADGRNEAGDWLRITFDDAPGWISRGLVNSEDDEAVDALPVLTEETFSPMQAFYFSTGIGQPTCNEAPDTLLIQGPQSMQVNLTVNGVNIGIGSTIALTTGTFDSDDSEDEDASNCVRNEMIVLDGEALLNDGSLTLPIGHKATFESCFDENEEIASTTEWENEGVVPQEELEERFAVLEQIPEDVFRYPVDIPTEAEIDLAINPPPLPSNTGTIIDTTTDTVTDTVTDVVSDLGVDCSNFVGTSPTGGMAFGPQAFYWNPAPGADQYRVVVDGLSGGQISGTVSGDATTLTLDIGVGALGQFGRTFDFQWYVQAFSGGEFACQTNPIFQNREFVSDDRLCTLLGGSYIRGTCYASDQSIIDIPQ